MLSETLPDFFKRQGGGILPVPFSWTRRRLALLRETPLHCVCFRAELSSWTIGGWAYWGHHAPSFSVDKVKDSDLFALGTTHLEMDTPFDSAEALRDHLIEMISVATWASPWGLVCSVPPILAEAHFARCVTSWTLCYHNSPQSVALGGRYWDFVDLPPHSCFLTWEWMSVSAKSYSCSFLYVAWPYPRRADSWGTLPLPCFRIHEWCIRWSQSVSRPSGTSIASTAYPIRLRKGMAVLVCYRVQSGPTCERSFPGCPSSHTSLLRLEERKLKTSFGNGLSLQRLSSHGNPRHCMGLLPSAGEETANIWPSMKRTWGCRDVLSRRTFSLWIWCSLVTQEVLKSLLFSTTWPQKDCVQGVGSDWKRSSHPSFQVNGDHCLLLQWSSYFNLPCVLLSASASVALA